MLTQDEMECPLCLEEIDVSDANFKPCPCGYQICRFCWHHIKQNLNGRCPACRRKYSDQAIEFKAMSTEECVARVLLIVRIMRLTNAKKNKEREKKEMEATNRKHLANMRVVQKNLVYVVGLSPRLAREEYIPTLKGTDYFGQYGRVAKILISKRVASHKYSSSHDPSIGVYVTYVNKEDAARAIVAIDGSKEPGGRVVRASYGTTKYCTAYLRNMPCSNPGCTYLHEPGEEADSFTKEDLSTLRLAARDTEHKIKPASMLLMPIEKKVELPSAGDTSIEGSALPRTASWATAGKAEMPATPPATRADTVAFPGLAAVREKPASPLRTPAAAVASPAKPKPRVAKGKARRGDDVSDAFAATSPSPSPQPQPPAAPAPSSSSLSLLDGALAGFGDGDFCFHLSAVPDWEQAEPAAGGNGLDRPALNMADMTPVYTPYHGVFNPFDEVSVAPVVQSQPPAPPGSAHDGRAAYYSDAQDALWRAQQRVYAREPRAMDERIMVAERPEDQRSAAAAMLAVRARQLQEAGEGASMATMSEVRSKLAQQQAAARDGPRGDSQSLLALLRRIQDAPEQRGSDAEAYAPVGAAAASVPGDVHAGGAAVPPGKVFAGERPETYMVRPTEAYTAGGVGRSAAETYANASASDMYVGRSAAETYAHTSAEDAPLGGRAVTASPPVAPGLTPPPGLKPAATQPNVATGLLLAQLLGTPTKDAYAPRAA